MKKVTLATLALIAIVLSFVNYHGQHQASVIEPNPLVVTTIQA